MEKGREPLVWSLCSVHCLRTSRYALGFHLHCVSRLGEHQKGNKRAGVGGELAEQQSSFLPAMFIFECGAFVLFKDFEKSIDGMTEILLYQPKGFSAL